MSYLSTKAFVDQMPQMHSLTDKVIVAYVKAKAVVACTATAGTAKRLRML